MNPGHYPCHNPCHRNPMRSGTFRRFSALLASFSAVFRRGNPLPLPARPEPGTRAGEAPPAPEREFHCNPCHTPEIGRNHLRLYPLPWPGFLADISALLPENPGHGAGIPATRALAGRVPIAPSPTPAPVIEPLSPRTPEAS